MTGHVLVADDEPDLRALFSDILQQGGLAVATACDSKEALSALREDDFDLVVSDICMPGGDGVEFLKQVHEQDPDLPVVLVTGRPSLETAIEAVGHGALQYLVKPVTPKALLDAVRGGLILRRRASLRREALEYLEGPRAQSPSDRDVEDVFTRALLSLWMAYQPIVWAKDATVYGFEALVRTAEPRVPDPGVLFATAEQLGRVWDVSRGVRALVAEAAHGDAPPRFVNVHPIDLGDRRLYDAREPLSAKARGIVLEITERAALGSIPDLRGKVRDLRQMGFRIAVDDLGAGYSGLSSFATLEPDVVKLDTSLVRGIDREPVKRKLVSSMTTLCRELGVLVVAEGVETREESLVLTELGCDLLQGFYFGRPGVFAAAV